MKRLTNTTLAELPANIIRPGYDRAAVTPGIVHLGIGAFHRAHQAAMTEACLNAGARDWGIIAASLRSPETRDALAPQDGLYTLGVRDGAATQLQVMGAVSDVLVAPENPARLIAAMAAPETRIVSITVSEKGYCHDPATGTLNESHPDIIHDLAHMDAPRTAPALIVAALAKRRASGLAPFTVLCCDNLPANGRTVKRVITRFASLLQPAFGDFLRTNLACPSTMVDRIVPATTDADRAEVRAALGVEDHWPVMTEPFLQWVIEDDFPLGRPDWASAGAEFVADVAPHELMKLRMLNGSHSMLAYLGTIAGLTYVADGAHDAEFAALLAGYWQEVAPTLPPGAGLDPADYARRLQARYENRAIRHRLIQIAMDGSQKLPQRQLHTLRARREAGLASPHIALTIAAFIEFMTGRTAAGEAYSVNDPLAAQFTARTNTAGHAAEALVPAILSIEPVFGDLATDTVFANAVIGHLNQIRSTGVRSAIRAMQAA
jgi:fructuronate reductase